MTTALDIDEYAGINVSATVKVLAWSAGPPIDVGTSVGDLA